MSKKKDIINSVEALIDSVKEYPILFQRLGVASGSVNNDEKNQAWIEIARQLHEEPSYLKKKWRNLRDSYTKAVKTKRDLEEMNQSSRYHPYRHEQRMGFLLPHVLQEISLRKRKSVKVIDVGKMRKDENAFMFAIDSSVSQAVEYLIETEDCDERTEEDEGQCEEEGSQEEQLDDNEYDESEQLGSESNLCYEEEEEEEEDGENLDQNMLSTQQQHHRAKSKDDDIEAWLSSVRESMNKLTKLNRARAKRDVNTILSKYEIEQYEAENC